MNVVFNVFKQQVSNFLFNDFFLWMDAEKTDGIIFQLPALFRVDLVSVAGCNIFIIRGFGVFSISYMIFIFIYFIF